MFVRKINNGYCDYYYLTEDGRIYNAQTNEYKDADKNNRFTLKKINGKRHKISLKVLYGKIYNRPYCKDDISDLEDEEWREIDNTKGIYYVSNKGRIKSYNGYKAIIMKQNKTNSGYYRLDIMQDGERVSKLVHRLVGASFLPIPDKLDMELHHKDFNKENNYSENLEWLTIAEHKKKHRLRSMSDAKL